jgi:hypothetical protein
VGGHRRSGWPWHGSELIAMKNILLVSSLLFMSVALTACERTWYLDVVDATDIAHPILCLSMKPKCTGEAVDLAILGFDEIDKSGKTIRPVWVIQAASNNPLKIVKFGAVPSGWAQVGPAAPLEAGKYYRVENHILSCRTDKFKNICSVYD